MFESYFRNNQQVDGCVKPCFQEFRKKIPTATVLEADFLKTFSYVIKLFPETGRGNQVAR